MQAELASATRFPSVGNDPRKSGRPFFGEIAIIAFNRSRDLETGIVERLARDEINGASNTAIDHVGRNVLEDFDASQKFWRDVIEGQHRTAGRGKDVAPVQFRTDKRQAANDDAGTLDREAIRVSRLFKAPDVNAGNALQRFCYRAIRQCAYVFRGNDVYKCIGILLYALGIFKRFAKATDDDLIFRFNGSCARVGFVGGLRECRLGKKCAKRKAGRRRKRRKTAGTHEF